MKKILMYGSNLERLNQFQQLCEEEGISFYPLNDQDLHLQLKVVFLKEEQGIGTSHQFSLEYLIVDGICEEDLLHFFERVKKTIGAYEGITITRTKINENWKLKDLFKETALENEIMKKVMELESMMREANQLNLNQFPEEQRERVKNELMKSYLLLVQDNYEKEQVQQQVDNLKIALGRK